MLTTFVIGLREGLEAALIVGIIAAFLIRRDSRQALRPMWWGVLAAVVLSGGAALALHAANRSLTLQARETMEGALALVAVAGITYMIVWMRRHSATFRADLEERASNALSVGSMTAVVGMAFVGVLREGLETAIFLLATFENANSASAAASGAILGIAVSVALGYGIYRGGIRIDLRRFFRVTGIVLVIVAAGLLAAAVHSFAEAGLITALQSPAIDLSWLIAPGTVRSSLLTAFFGFQPVPTVAEVVVWTAFLIPMLWYVSGFTLPHRQRRLAV
ncbi:MAG: FTR1 family protein [Acidimicrobiia bacterium]|nr:FTR1 family protein [Acidimicrobiia bacterium]